MRAKSILAIGEHLDKFVRFHALDAEVPVALSAAPPIDAFRLVEASDPRQAVGGSLDLVAGPRPRMVRWVHFHWARCVGAGLRDDEAKLDILEELGGY